MHKTGELPSIGTRTRPQEHSQELQFLPFNQGFLSDRWILSQISAVQYLKQNKEVSKKFAITFASKQTSIKTLG